MILIRCFLILIVACYSSSIIAETIRIGLRAYSGAEQGMKRWQPTADYLSQMIPEHNFVMMPYTDIDELVSRATNKEFDFVLTNPSSYVELELVSGASRMLTIKNKRQGQAYTKFGSVIFVRADSDIYTLSDLKDKRFMAVFKSAFGGWRVASREFYKNNIDPKKYFKSLSFAGGLQPKVVLSVINGDADAGSVRTDMLERMHEKGLINLNDIRVLNPQYVKEFPFLLSTDLYPEWPFSKFNHTSIELAEEVAIALLEMPKSHTAAIDGKYVGWTVPLDYSSVHDLMRDLKVGPYKNYGHISLQEILYKYLYWIMTIFILFLIAWGLVIFSIKSNIKLSKIQKELFNSKHNLEQAHDLLEDKIIERTKELKLSKEVAEKANKAKSEFLSSMSHELRTPLNAILGFTQLLEHDDEYPLNKDQLENLEYIHKSSLNLLSLIDQVLNLSKIELGRLDVSIENFNISKIINECLSLIELQAKNNEVIFVLNEIPDRLVTADPILVKQVILNLVINAIKYNKKNGTVNLSCHQTENSYFRIIITDTGIGISKDKQLHLFEEFSRLGQENSAIGGMGIGLVITSHILKAMNGRIGFESKEGEGSTFWFDLPTPAID